MTIKHREPTSAVGRQSREDLLQGGKAGGVRLTFPPSADLSKFLLAVRLRFQRSFHLSNYSVFPSGQRGETSRKKTILEYE